MRIPHCLVVQPVERSQGFCCGLVAHAMGERGEVEIVARCVAFEDQDALDAEDLRLGWNGQRRVPMLERRRFQWLSADQLTHPGLDSVEAPEGASRGLSAIQPLILIGLECRRTGGAGRAARDPRLGKGDARHGWPLRSRLPIRLRAGAVGGGTPTTGRGPNQEALRCFST